jgi:hypothetical protein
MGVTLALGRRAGKSKAIRLTSGINTETGTQHCHRIVNCFAQRTKVDLRQKDEFRHWLQNARGGEICF